MIKIGGIYKHYNGKFYKTTGIYRHSETLEMYVAYKALKKCGDLGKYWIRPLSMFCEQINEKTPRFKLVKK